MPEPSVITSARSTLTRTQWVWWPRDLKSTDPVGGKARNLLSLIRNSFPVPRWFVVLPGNDCPIDAARRDELSFEIGIALRELAPEDQMVAVRSSAQEEDGFEHSFAGQLESYLFVPPQDVTRRVLDVWQSSESTHAARYRREHGIATRSPLPAVIIQRMVNSHRAGVAFTADAISGRRGIVVINATSGTAAALVSGALDGDTYRVDRTDQLVDCVTRSNSEMGGSPSRRPVVGNEQFPRPLLTNSEIVRVARLARRVQAHFRSPQDVEWAMDEEGELFVLQARPITTIKDLLDPDGTVRIWDNSNIVESYGGVTTPMTFSFARHCYEQVYRQFCRLLRVAPETITRNAAVFHSMLGFIEGRIYYNLLNWYSVLAMLPGYRFNRIFMEQMMGVRESLSPATRSTPAQNTVTARALDGVRMLAACLALVREHLLIEKKIARFHRRINGVLGARPDLSQHRPEELVALYRDIESQLLSAWDAPLVNDFLAMIFYGLLRRLSMRWCGSGRAGLEHDLLANEGGMISAEPAQRIREMAAMLEADKALQECFKDGSRLEIEHAIDSTPHLRDALRAYIEQFGDRCQDELKLESPTLYDDPLPLYRSIGQLASVRQPGRERSDSTSSREQTIDTILAHHPFRRLFFRWILDNCRNRVRDRENLRFERTRVFGRVRMILIELGHRLHDLGFLESPRDIFFLQIDEVLGFVEGTGASSDLRGLARLRKREHERWLKSPPPAERFETRGAVHAKGNSFRASANSATASGEERKGVGASPGRIRGQVKVVRSTSEPPPAGAILVAERADPSWILLFPLAAGVILERGSVLSHVSIVGREMGIPMVASVPGLTAWLSDGDLVEIDGATGIITRIKAATGDARAIENTQEKTKLSLSHVRKPAPIASIPGDALVRYGQCWEDADVLCQALAPRAGDHCLSIASGGENTLALLASNPARVTAVDTNPAQLACLALKVAAFRNLQHQEMLELLGWRASDHRVELFRRLRQDLEPAYRDFWDNNLSAIASGAVNIGRFEQYLRRFRKYVLPLIHREDMIDQLLQNRDREQRAHFYREVWNTVGWRSVFKIFFSQPVMQCLGRDRKYFRYAKAPIAAELLERTRHALIELEPASNPYLQWILRGDQSEAVPFALRQENFDQVRSSLDRLEICCSRVEDAIREYAPFDRLNLSDVFESMSPAQHCSVLESIVESSRSGARLVYWNMAVERRRPESLADRLRSLDEISAGLFPHAQAFFYQDLVIEEVV